jgi:hypothetical protein
MAMRKAPFENGVGTLLPGSSRTRSHPGIDATEDTVRLADKSHPTLAFGQPGAVRTTLDLSRRHRWESPPLGSSSIGRLLGLQPARQCLQPTRSISGPCKTQQLHNGLFIGLGLLFPQPVPRPLDLSGALPLPSWGSIQLNRPKGVAGRGDGTVFQGRPTRTAAGDSTAIWPAVRSKAAVVVLPIMRAMGRKSVTGVNCAWTTT